MLYEGEICWPMVDAKGNCAPKIDPGASIEVSYRFDGSVIVTGIGIPFGKWTVWFRVATIDEIVDRSPPEVRAKAGLRMGVGDDNLPDPDRILIGSVDIQEPARHPG